jgi:hypothetical protein
MCTTSPNLSASSHDDSFKEMDISPALLISYFCGESDLPGQLVTLSHALNGVAI